jgi:transposase
LAIFPLQKACEWRPRVLDGVCVTTNNPATAIQATVKSLLRHVQDFAGFAVESVSQTLAGPSPRIDVELAPARNYKRRCSCCGQSGRIHDMLPKRRWHFVPLWNIPVYLHYAPRRVVCPVRGAPTVEAIPWSRGKSPYSVVYMIFLARWARRLSWKDTATIFSASWDAVRRCVEWCVAWGIAHRDLSGVEAIGIDEIHHGRGKGSLNFLTLIYQVDRGSRRLLWIGRSRKQATLRQGFDELEAWCPGFLSRLKVVCSDMWKPYLKVVRQLCGQALNVLDPFHIAKHLNTAIDTVRRGEQSRLRDKEGSPSRQKRTVSATQARPPGPRQSARKTPRRARLVSPSLTPQIGNRSLSIACVVFRFRLALHFLFFVKSSSF